MIDSKRTLTTVLDGYRLRPWGIHGVPHWARVFENARLLAAKTGANLEVVELFALLHDARRVNDNSDPQHGPRAATLAHELRGVSFELADDDFADLVFACEMHTAGLTAASPTVQTCWDADRLDLGRIGIVPQGNRLCTAAARELARSQVTAGFENALPRAITEQWGWRSNGNGRAATFSAG